MAKDTPVPDDARSKIRPEAKTDGRNGARPEARAVGKAEAKDKPDAAAQPGGKGKRGRGLLYAMLGVLVATAAGAFAYQQWVDDAPATAADAQSIDEARPAETRTDDAKPAPPKTDPLKPPQFVTLEPFTVNLRAESDADHLLQVGLVFQVSGAPVAEAMKQRMPVIRSNVLLLLTSKSQRELGSVDGKTTLSAELLATVRQALPGEDPEKGVPAVHYSAFIIQ